MSILEKLLGDSVAKPVEAIGKIIDEIHTSKSEQIDAEIKLTEVSNKLRALQAEITLQESKHRSAFVAGWRPAIGWVCGIGLLINFVIAPLISPLAKLNTVDTSHLITMALTMMGVAGLRTVEKAKGLTR